MRAGRGRRRSGSRGGIFGGVGMVRWWKRRVYLLLSLLLMVVEIEMEIEVAEVRSRYDARMWDWGIAIT